jgi:amino acid transporter
MTGIALPRARRRRRRPFGPREKRALAWVLIGVFCVLFYFIEITGDMAGGDVNAWTAVDAALIVLWVRWIIPSEWKVVRAWLDSVDDA